MNDPRDVIWFALAGVVVPTLVLTLLRKWRTSDSEHTAAAESGGTARTDRDTP